MSVPSASWIRRSDAVSSAEGRGPAAALDLVADVAGYLTDQAVDGVALELG